MKMIYFPFLKAAVAPQENNMENDTNHSILQVPIIKSNEKQIIMKERKTFSEEMEFAINHDETLIITDYKFLGTTTFNCYGTASLQLENIKFHGDVYIETNVCSTDSNADELKNVTVTACEFFEDFHYSDSACVQLVNNSFKKHPAISKERALKDSTFNRFDKLLATFSENRSVCRAIAFHFLRTHQMKFLAIAIGLATLVDSCASDDPFISYKVLALSLALISHPLYIRIKSDIEQRRNSASNKIISYFLAVCFIAVCCAILFCCVIVFALHRVIYIQMGNLMVTHGICNATCYREYYFTEDSV